MNKHSIGYRKANGKFQSAESKLINQLAKATLFTVYVAGVIVLAPYIKSIAVAVLTVSFGHVSNLHLTGF